MAHRLAGSVRESVVDSPSAGHDSATLTVDTTMTPFRWLHLTDLHYGQALQGSRLQNVEQYLLDGLPEVLKDCGKPLDAVMFTGDLAYSGDPAEFSGVNELLGRIYETLGAVGAGAPVLLVVPGNHDAVRALPPDPVRSLVAELEARRDADDHRLSLRRRPAVDLLPYVSEAFRNYKTWYDAHPFPRPEPSTYREGELPGDFSATLTKDGVRLGVLGLNTSALQIIGGDLKGRLMVFEEQFGGACGGDGPRWAASHDACLLLTHQPPDWLDPEARRYMTGEVCVPGRFAIHLFGHTHEHDLLSSSRGGEKPVVTFESVSLFGWEPRKPGAQEPDRRHGFTLARLDVGRTKGQVRFWPRVTCTAPDGHRFLGLDPTLEYTRGHLGPLDVPVHQVQQNGGQAADSASDRSEFDRWFAESFDYCLQRRRKPDVTSNTCMYFFGADFNERNPVLKPASIIGAIGTELEHLAKVNQGEPHNHDKPTGSAQIADEIVDMMRFLLMLAIAYGIEEWRRLPWADWFIGALRAKRPTPIFKINRTLSEHYAALLEASQQNRIDRSWLAGWLGTQVRALAGIARCQGVTLREILGDLADRLRPAARPEPTTLHVRREFPTSGTYLICRAYFRDEAGTYRDLLREVADARFDVLASASHTVTHGETAEAVLLMATTDKTASPAADIDARLDGIRESVFRPPGTKHFGVRPDTLLIAFDVLHRESFDTKTVQDRQRFVAASLARFRTSVKELWGSPEPSD